MTRILAHHIFFEGKDYPMSVAEISTDLRKCSITPYRRETAATRFVSGSISIRRQKSGLFKLEKIA